MGLNLVGGVGGGVHYLGDILLPASVLLLLDDELALYPLFWIRLSRRATHSDCSSGDIASSSMSRALRGS